MMMRMRQCFTQLKTQHVLVIMIPKCIQTKDEMAFLVASNKKIRTTFAYICMHAKFHCHSQHETTKMFWEGRYKMFFKLDEVHLPGRTRRCALCKTENDLSFKTTWVTKKHLLSQYLRHHTISHLVVYALLENSPLIFLKLTKLERGGT